MKPGFMRPIVRLALCSLVVAALFLLISEWTGFGDWIAVSPVATALVRGFVVIVIGPLALIALIWPPRDDPDWGPWGFRGAVLFALVLAIAQASLLFGDPLELSSS